MLIRRENDGFLDGACSVGQQARREEIHDKLASGL